MILDNEVKLDYSDVLLRPKRSTLASRNEVSLEREFKFRNSGATWTGVPIVSSNMDTTGTTATADALAQHRMLTCLHKFYKPEKLKDLSKGTLQHVAVTVGIRDGDLDVLKSYMDAVEPAFICLDVPNGYTERFATRVSEVRALYPKTSIIAGNVVTGEMTEQLILSGADIVKIGIGPGSVCTTRRQTGIGFPQLSAIIECADAAHGLDGMIMADGGCTVPGDVAKAFGAGADFVMLGGMFAGHDESGGDLVEKDGVKFKRFYGMSSEEAMEKHYGGVAKYKTHEGKSIEMRYKGSIHDTVQEILGGVRSACTYIGARKLKHMPKCTTFIRVNRQLNEVYGKV